MTRLVESHLFAADAAIIRDHFCIKTDRIALVLRITLAKY